MITLNVESHLESPLSGCQSIMIDPTATVRAIITSYLLAKERTESDPGLVVLDKDMNKLDWSDVIQDIGIEDGSKIYISHCKAFPVCRPHYAVIGISTLVIGIFLLVSSSVLYFSTGGYVLPSYGIVIDAGSTHTEVFLYEWPSMKSNGTGIVHQKGSCEYEDGIANGFDPIHIISCINNVTVVIPIGSRSPRLYLGATGGMRLLNLTNPMDAKLILMTLKYALKSRPVQVETIDILQGYDEALSSWISTNILSKTLEKQKHTFGALDLGGASTQYAFSIDDKTSLSFSNIEDITLYGQKYAIASESFLCFGYMEALKRMESILLMNNNSNTLYDSCLPTGFVREFEAKSFSKEACVENENFSSWFKNTTNINKFIIIGSSNYEECKKNVKQLTNENDCSEMGFSQCLHKINLGLFNSKFMAFSGFYYVVSYLNGTDSLDKFIDASRMWCSMSWKEMQDTQPKFQLEHVSMYCFASIYITDLLTSVYGFNSTTWKNIAFTKEINDEDVGWTLGYMTKATNNITDGLPTPPMLSLKIFLPLFFVGIMMFLIGILLINKPIRNYYKYTRFAEMKNI